MVTIYILYWYFDINGKCVGFWVKINKCSNKILYYHNLFDFYTSIKLSDFEFNTYISGVSKVDKNYAEIDQINYKQNK